MLKSKWRELWMTEFCQDGVDNTQSFLLEFLGHINAKNEKKNTIL